MMYSRYYKQHLSRRLFLQKKKSKKFSFTLVDMSIIIVLVALLVGGIVVGQDIFFAMGR